MKVYVVVGFKKENGGYYPCMMEIFASMEAAEKHAASFNGFTTITEKHVN